VTFSPIWVKTNGRRSSLFKEIQGNKMLTLLKLCGLIATSYLPFVLTPGIAKPPQTLNPEFGVWFRGLKAPNGTGCCSEADCRQVESRLTQGGYEVMIRSRWIPVPWERVLRRTDNPTGRAIVCYTPDDLILCFVRPPDA
jgi:hypothetical protein